MGVGLGESEATSSGRNENNIKIIKLSHLQKLYVRNVKRPPAIDKQL